MLTQEQLRHNPAFSDQIYNNYSPIGRVQIFHYLMDDEDTQDCDINLSTNYSAPVLLPVLNDYLDWLKNCATQLTTYFQKKSNLALPPDWFETIEVYHFSITINSPDDYGATITCGESQFMDHTIAFDFQKHQVIDERLNG